MSPASSQLRMYLRLLTAHAAPRQFLDLRWQSSGEPMRRRALPALALDDATRAIERLAAHGDVYLGVALREHRQHAGKHAITGSRFVFIECDRIDSRELVEAFAFPPSIVIASGSPGHLHLYWRLAQLAAADQIESANRRLAQLLAGDPGCVDISRVLRPPGTLNYKHSPPAPVRLRAYRYETYGLGQLLKELPTDPAPALPSRRQIVVPSPWNGSELERLLREISSVEYARVLTGRLPNRDSKILCPFHDERTPSLHLYPDGTFYCFGSPCRKGGSIFDFAAHLWNLVPRDDGFTEILKRLAHAFGLESLMRSPS